MNDINWKDVDFLPMDPNVVYKIKMAFNDPITDLGGQFGKWWKWGCYFKGEPYCIKSGMNSALLKLLDSQGVKGGDEVEIVKMQKGKDITWSVNSQTWDDKEVSSGKTNGSANNHTKDLVTIAERLKKASKLLLDISDQIGKIANENQ